MTAKDNEGNKGEVTNITKITIYCRVYKRVCKVFGSSARWMMSVADVDQVVDRCSWMSVCG